MGKKYVFLGLDLWSNVYILEPLAKWSSCPNSALCSNFYPWNINYMTVVNFFCMP